MKYTVEINEKSKTVAVNLNGYKGVAKCCETDTFNLQTGIELALERARVAEANAKKTNAAISGKPMSVMELIKALEKALPKGQMVVVGNGAIMTAEQKRWLHSLSGCTNKGGYTKDDLDEAYDEGYEDGQNSVSDRYDDGYGDGYDEGYNDAVEEYEDACDECDCADELAEKIRAVLEDYEG